MNYVIEYHGDLFEIRESSLEAPKNLKVNLSFHPPKQHLN